MADFFVTPVFGLLSQVAMTAALKVFARGTLTFFEITIVVLFVVSLVTMAALGCLGVRRRNRPIQISGVLLDQLNPNRQSNLIAR